MNHPDRLGKYAINGVLGEGAMGVVYKAFDAGIGRPVAIKTIRENLPRDSGAEGSLSERFLNEARAVGRMNHPNIVAIYELGEDQGNAFIAMEYVEGRDLAQILAATPVLTEPVVLRVMTQLLDALEYAHRQGVWHRDIKPANLIITAAGQLKVTDFGIAKIESAALTQVASTIGTPGYMAPEQYVGEAFDHRVDIFAAGVLLYRMLAGRAPFTGSAEAVMYSILNSEPPPLSQFAPTDIASFYGPVVAGALVKNPERRYANATAFREALLRRKTVDTASSADADATMIVRASSEGGEPPLTKQIDARLTAGVQAHNTAVAGWDDDSLTPVRSALARFTGPMAKVLVRQAASKCSDLPTLVALLADELTNADDRAKFLLLVRQPANAGNPGTAVQAMPATIGAASATGHQPVPASLIELANGLMAKHLGPIARIIVKRTAARAVSPEQFVASLAQEVPDGPKRAQLVAELQAKL